MKAKKSFGQHFLINKMAVDRIVEKFGAINATGKALEVGPGMGVLTEKLLSTYPSLTAVEADHDMVTHLHNRFPLLNVVEADFLKTDLKQLMNAQEFGLVGNFPYNISSQIVFKMLDYKEYVPVMVGMFQKEMAERIVAGPGSKTYGVISILTQAYYQGQLLFHLSPSDFNPPPKVDSSVIILTRKEDTGPQYNNRLFTELVKTTFNQRRKMIRNTLKQYLPEHILNEPFYQKRPETLSLEDFINLTINIENYEPGS